MKRAPLLSVALLALALSSPVTGADASHSGQPLNSKSAAPASKVTPAATSPSIASTSSPPKPAAKNEKTKKQIADQKKSHPTDSHTASSMPSLATTPALHTDIRQPSDSSGTTNGAAPTPPAPGASQNVSDIDTPGMLADDKGATTKADAANLTLDLLPGETAEQARIDQANASALTLRIPMSADQLHNPNSTTKALSSADSATNRATPVTNNTPVQSRETQPKMVPVIMPVHPPPKDPYDILNH